MSSAKQVRSFLLGIGAFTIATSAQAATYDAVKDFSATSPIGVFSYGTGVTGTSFTPYTNYSAPCQGMVTGLGCWQTTTPVSLVPLVGKNLTGSTLDFSTVVLPTDVLLVHPGPSTNSIVRFTAPITGKYNVSGFYELLDTNPSGVNVIIAFDNTVVFDQALSGPPAVGPGTPGGLVAFGASGIFLHAGDFLDYGVNNAGSFYNDSTGLALTFATVPEPAAWAMMLAGFGLLGGSMRRARRPAAAA